MGRGWKIYQGPPPAYLGRQGGRAAPLLRRSAHALSQVGMTGGAERLWSIKGQPRRAVPHTKNRRGCLRSAPGTFLCRVANG